MTFTSLTYTLCFLTRGDDILMLLRISPPTPASGMGLAGALKMGKRRGKSCLREVHEETGYRISQAHFGGVLVWEGFEVPVGGLYIFTADAPPGDPAPLENEGQLAWKPREWVGRAPEVVSNIHHFLPPVLAGEPPREYYFSYQDGRILHRSVRPLPEDIRRLLQE